MTCCGKKTAEYAEERKKKDQEIESMILDKSILEKHLKAVEEEFDAHVDDCGMPQWPTSQPGPEPYMYAPVNYQPPTAGPCYSQPNRNNQSYQPPQTQYPPFYN